MCFFFCWTIALSTDWLGKTISNCLAEPIFLILKLLGKTITLSYRVCLFAAFCISKTMEIVLLTLDFVCVVRISARQFKLSYRDCNLCLSYCYVYISLQDNRARQFLLSCPILHLLHWAYTHTITYIYTRIRTGFSSLYLKLAEIRVFQALSLLCYF